MTRPISRDASGKAGRGSERVAAAAECDGAKVGYAPGGILVRRASAPPCDSTRLRCQSNGNDHFHDDLHRFFPRSCASDRAVAAGSRSQLHSDEPDLRRQHHGSRPGNAALTGVMDEMANAGGQRNKFALLSKPDVWRVSTVKLLIALILLFAVTPFVESLPNGDLIESGFDDAGHDRIPDRRGSQSTCSHGSGACSLFRQSPQNGFPIFSRTMFPLTIFWLSRWFFSASPFTAFFASFSRLGMSMPRCSAQASSFT